jgi:polyisoprenoid-binding protein YceI
VRLLAAALLLLAVPAARGQTTLDVVPGESQLHYEGEALFHDWRGTSRQVTGRITVVWSELPHVGDVVLRVPTATFDSGNRMRDNKMQQVTRAADHPEVVFRMRDASLLLWTVTDEGGRGVWRLTGTLSFAGTTRPVSTDADIVWDSETLTASGFFPVSLEAFRIDRPTLLGSPIDDTIVLRYRIVAR